MAQPPHWRTFDALRDDNFRWLWIGQLAFSANFQMGNLAQGWIVYQITGSAFALGWVSSGWTPPSCSYASTAEPSKSQSSGGKP
jgi:hypothetical protein